MCFNGSAPDIDTTYQDQMQADATAARVKEEARQGRITEGNAALDTQFGQFDAGFFDNYLNTQMDFVKPQADKQFKTAQDDLTYAFARNGTLNSSAAGQRQADLSTSYSDNLASLLSNAQQSTDGLRSRIGGEKNSLVAQLNATGDADRVSGEALSRAQQIYQQQPSYNPLGDMFGGFASGVGAVGAGQQRKAANDAYFGTASTAGNSRVVG